MATKVKPIPDGFHAVTPSLTLKNSLKALAFYKKAFGAEVGDVFPSPDGGHTMHATMKIGDSILMMGDESPDIGCKSAESLGASPVNLYLYVSNVDAVFKKAVDAGASVIMPVGDMFWGDRCGVVKDPFGYSWNIATHIGEPTREEVEKGAKAFFAKAGKP
jgi:PhnB protein